MKILINYIKIFSEIVNDIEYHDLLNDSDF